MSMAARAMSSRAVSSMSFARMRWATAVSGPSLLHRGRLGAERLPAVGDEPPGAVRGGEAAQAEGHERPAPRRGGRAGRVRQVEDPAEHDRRDRARAEAEE